MATKVKPRKKQLWFATRLRTIATEQGKTKADIVRGSGIGYIRVWQLWELKHRGSEETFQKLATALELDDWHELIGQG